MAQSRLEKFGNIYTRITALLRSGVIQDIDKPIWYEIYTAFPPKYEPQQDRVIPKLPMRKILYKEDIIRARFHKDCKRLEAMNLSVEKNRLSQTQIFLDLYYNSQKSGLSEDEAYEDALKCIQPLSLKENSK